MSNEEIVNNATEGKRPPSFLSMLQRYAPAIAAGPMGATIATPIFASTFMDNRQFNQRKEKLLAEVNAANPSDSATQQALQASKEAGEAALNAAGGSTKKSGYLGVDDMLKVQAAGQVTDPDGTVRYVVDTKDGARNVLYKEGDPYKALQSLGPAELKEWRRTMWLGGYLEPDSFVGALTVDDVAAMQTAMTEANMTGVKWTDAIASRVELGARYGRPITEAEIAELDDDVPSMIKGYASKNGISVSDDFIARMQKRVLNGKDTPDGVLARLRDTYVKPMYPQFADELDNGLTLEDIASPYLDTASKMLEIPPQQISLNDPLIKKALQARDDQGTPVRKPLWAFEDELTKDPRWKYTNNAYAAMDSAVNGMISEMGL